MPNSFQDPPPPPSLFKIFVWNIICNILIGSSWMATLNLDTLYNFWKRVKSQDGWVHPLECEKWGVLKDPYIKFWQMRSLYISLYAKVPSEIFLLSSVLLEGIYNICTNYKPTYWKLQGCNGALVKLGMCGLIGCISWSVDHSAHMALGGSKFLLAHILQQEWN